MTMSQSQRFERFSTISSTQVHDLKNRLTVIKGVSQLLSRQVRRADWEQDRIIQRVDHLQQEVVRLEILVNDLMQGDAGTKESQNHRSVQLSDA